MQWPPLAFIGDCYRCRKPRASPPRVNPSGGGARRALRTLQTPRPKAINRAISSKNA